MNILVDDRLFGIQFTAISRFGFYQSTSILSEPRAAAHNETILSLVPLGPDPVDIAHSVQHIGQVLTVYIILNTKKMDSQRQSKCKD